VNTAVASHRGPRKDIDVRKVLLDTAELLFSESGVSATSMRSITTSAGVSSAVASYHFASKEGLLLALLERRGTSILKCLDECLEVLSRRTSAPTVRQIVEALLEPCLEMLAADPAGGLRWIKVLAQLMIYRDPQWMKFAGLGLGRDQVVIGLLLRASPKADRKAIVRQANLASYGLITSLSHLDAPLLEGALGPQGVDPAIARELVAYTAAGLRAIL
jgi:AcrR family transcriptional regulator